MRNGPGSPIASPAFAVFFFLLVRSGHRSGQVSPSAYDAVIATYKTPIVNLMEVGLVGAVSSRPQQGSGSSWSTSGRRGPGCSGR